jgi:transcriptional regulator with GAF, ATPase, and Fis domain
VAPGHCERPEKVAPLADIDRDLAGAVAELSSIVLAGRSVTHVLRKIARMAKDIIPGAAEASVTVITDERAHSAAYTGTLALHLDELQYAERSGPCLDGPAASATIVVKDMTAETRWPRYSPSAVAAGVRSSMSIPLSLQCGLRACLNVYGVTPEAFGEEALRIGRTFASYAAVVVQNAHLYAWGYPV